MSIRIKLFATAFAAVLAVTSAAYASSQAAGRLAPARLDRTGLFEPNVGQFAPSTKFLAHADSYDAVFGIDFVEFVTAGKHQARMTFPGSLPAVPHGMRESDVSVSLFEGNDPSRWRTGVSMTRELIYRNVYPGIDLSFTFNQGRLEHSWLLAPGADPGTIRVRFGDARDVATNGREVVVHAERGTFRMASPLVYEEEGRHRRPVTATYVKGPRQTLRFRLGKHDPRNRVIIDPVIDYASYFGGSDRDWMEQGTMALDPDGNIYVSGKTWSFDLPASSNSVLPTWHSTDDMFVAKFRPDGMPVFTAYVGGNGRQTTKTPIAADSTGVYIACGTESSDFPTTPNAYQRKLTPAKTRTGARPDMDAAFAKISPDGSRLLYGTFFGGSDDDRFLSLAIGRDGRVALGGTTFSPDVPVTDNAWQRQLRSPGEDDGVIAVFDTGGRLVASSLFGGKGAEGYDGSAGVLVDEHENVIYLSTTTAHDLLTTEGAMLRTIAPNVSTAGFVAKLSPDLSQLIFSTYFGGPLSRLRDVAMDPSGDIYVVGDGSASWPADGRAGDGYLCRIAADGTHMVWARHVGGRGIDWPYAVAPAPDGNSVWMAGLTSSSDFPVTADAFQPVLLHSGAADTTGFLTQLDSRDGSVLFSTYVGSAKGQYESLGALAFDGDGSLWVWGDTDGVDFPVTADAAQPMPKGSFDGILLKIRVAARTSTALSSSPNPSALSETVTLTALVVPQNATGTVTFYDGDVTIGSAPLSQGSASISTTSLAPGSHSLTAAYLGNPALAPSASPPLIEIVASGPKRRSARH